VHIRQDIAAPAERVFAALDDHANMGMWLGPPVSLIKNVADGGVGSVRRIRAAGLAIDEEILSRDAPYSLSYRILSGVPLLKHHHGEVKVEALDETQSRVHWHVEVAAALPGLASLIGLALRATLTRGLRRLNRQLAQ
jgi:uncharacterized protein YndB with AHSA1/START domain